MGRKLVVLFDGTWNNGRDKTNVFLIKQHLAEHDSDGNEQKHCYIEGVGTKPYTRFLGGMFGAGLGENLMEGYQWLCQHHRDGDEIYTFGFSRGAYTARSLGGIIRKCGLLVDPYPTNLDKAYMLYRDKDVAPKDPPAQHFRGAFSKEVRVRFIGVWDTVGSMGIPITGVPFGRDSYQWHDTRLSKIVDYAYHAIAVDEHRKDFDVAVWENILKEENREVEQRWFIGAHANIGGGYDNDRLHRIPLQWMIRKAHATGLRFTHNDHAGPHDHLHVVRDSYNEFMHGLYRHFKDRHNRQFGHGQRETIDTSVWERWHTIPGYHPDTLSNQIPPEKP